MPGVARVPDQAHVVAGLQTGAKSSPLTHLESTPIEMPATLTYGEIHKCHLGPPARETS